MSYFVVIWINCNEDWNEFNMISTNIIFHRLWRVTCRSGKKHRISARHERVESERERDDEVDCGRRTARKDSTVSGLSGHAHVGSGKSRMTASTAPDHDHETILVPPVGQSGREQLRQECYDIRIDVFHHEQGFPLDAVIDELRPSLIRDVISV